jgi:hypothetical protein
MRAKADIGVVLAGVALFAAVALFGAAATRAAMGGRVPLPSLSRNAEAAQPAAARAPASAPAEATADVPLVTPSSVVASSPDARVPSEVLSMAVKRAPFDPDRQPATQRYLLPEEIAPPRREQPPPQRPAPPQFRVLGTVVAPAGNVAVVQLADGKKRVMTVGQEMEGYRVAAIASGAVVMSGQGWDLTFAVADAQPIGPNRPQRDANGRIIQQDRAQQARAAALTTQLQRAARELTELREGVAPGGQYVQWRFDGDVLVPTSTPTRGEIQIAPTPEMIFFRRPAPPGGG